MVKRIVGAVLIMLGTFFAYMGIWTAAILTGFFFNSGGDWLGPEPELLIPIAALLVAALLCWLGARLWKQREPR